MATASQPQTCGKCGTPLSRYAPDGLCAGCLLESAFENPDARMGESLEPAPLLAFNDYELLGEIARGGMGVVYRARQVSLNRPVAIKMILGGHLARAADTQRFRAEAEIAAQLQHQNIVAIHEVGEHAGQPFFSMDLVQGQNLAQLVRNEPLPSHKAAEYLKTIAEAVQYAHSRGVLHRDLKPSNILIDENDQPRITDFGLAKRLGDSQLTQTGQVLGSPSFIPPEQATGEKSAIDPVSDVYSLGAILYYCVTGRPPFVAETLTQTLRLVAEADPVSPRLLNASVPLDLETICLKCLAKEPKHRYSSAKELSEEFGRFLRDEPIRARPVGKFERFRRWTRRHPVTAALTGIIGLLLVVVTVISTVAAARLQRANREGQEKLRDAYLSEARALRFSGREGRRFGALDAIRKAMAIRPGLDLRNEAIAAMALVDLRPEREWVVSDRGMLFDPSFERYAQPDTNGAMVLRRTRDDEELMRMPGARFPPFEFLFSPEGGLLAVHYRGKGGANYDFKVYDLKNSGNVIFDMPGRWVRMCRISGDDRLLAVAWKDLNSDNPHRSMLSFVDLESSKNLNSFTSPALPWGMAFSPDARQIAIASGDDWDISSGDEWSLSIYSVPAGKVLQTLVHTNGTQWLDWSSDGRNLASAGLDGYIYVWDMRSPSPSAQMLPHGYTAMTCKFTPRGDILTSFGWNYLAKLWEVQTGREVLRLSCDGWFGTSSDGKKASVRRRPGTVGISEFAAGEECRSFSFGAKTTGADVGFSPDGRWMASAHRDGLRLWDLATGREEHLADVGEVAGLQFIREGSALILQTAQQIMSWPIRSSTGKENTRIEVGPPGFWRPERIEAGGPANRMLRIVKNQACLFDASSLSVERYLTTTSGIFGGTISRDGRYCATWRRDTAIVDVWDAENGRHLATPSLERASCASFSPDGRWLITGSSQEYTFWEFGLWRRARTIPRGETGGAPGKVSFTKDGKVMALVLGRGEVELFDATTFEPLARFEPREVDTVKSLDFSVDGSKLAVGTTGNTIYVWDLRLVRERLAELGLDIPRPPLPRAPPSSGSLELSIVGPPASAH